MEKLFRIGHGYDIHTILANKPMILGGVLLPVDYGLEGHSDADVLTHALADAILGALALPDIGHYFPNTDNSLRGMNSQIILAKAVEEARQRSYFVSNVDISIIAQRPKISPFIAQMKAVLVETLHISIADIGIKATTHEGHDSLGRGESLAAHAVVLLEQRAGKADLS